MSKRNLIIVLSIFLLFISFNVSAKKLKTIENKVGINLKFYSDVSYHKNLKNIKSNKAKTVKTKLTITETPSLIKVTGKKEWTTLFNGEFSSPVIVLHQNDFLELTLENNKTNAFQYDVNLYNSSILKNIVNLTDVYPGEEVTIKLNMAHPGVFVYKCIPNNNQVEPWSRASTLDGVIVVLPKEGLKNDQNEAIQPKRALYVPNDSSDVAMDDLAWRSMDLVKTMKSFITRSGDFGYDVEPHILKTTIDPTRNNPKLRAKVLINPNKIMLNVKDQSSHAKVLKQDIDYLPKPQSNVPVKYLSTHSVFEILREFDVLDKQAYLDRDLVKLYALGSYGHIHFDQNKNHDLFCNIAKKVIV